MKFFAVAAALLTLISCSDDNRGPRCSLEGNLELDLTYTDGDCLEPGYTELLKLNIKADGDGYTAYERGEPVDSTEFRAPQCELLVGSSFYYPETESSWEILGTVELEIDLLSRPLVGSGRLDALVYVENNPESCTQEIEIGP